MAVQERAFQADSENLILNQAKDNFHQLTLSVNKELPSHAAKWEDSLLKIKRDISLFQTDEEAIGYAQSRIDFDHRMPLSKNEAELYENSLKSQFPQFSHSIPSLQESNCSIESTLLNYNGRCVSNVIYYQYRYLLQCLAYVKQPKIICEIGGGYGSPARLWMSNPIFVPNVCIILDFPECLFFAEVFLKRNFNDSGYSIVHLKDLSVEKIPSLSKTIVLCPIGSENLLSSIPIDLAINTGSMQEMTDVWIDYWMRWLDQSQIRYFYSLNYCALPITKRGKECGNIYSPRLSSQWSYLLNNAKGPFPGAFEFANSAEIIAQNNGPVQSKDHLRSILHKKIASQMDVQNFVESLNIIRLCPEQEMIWGLIRSVLKDMNFIPQEMVYLVNLLKKNGSEVFLKGKRGKLNKIDRHLNRLLSSGRWRKAILVRLHKFLNTKSRLQIN